MKNDLISKREVLEDLSEPFAMSQCMTVEECEAMNRARKLCLARVENIESVQRWVPYIEALAGMPAGVGVIALAYARSIVTFGVNIAEKWETVTQQQAALDSAYRRGRYDEWKRWAGKEEP